jgi:hypothetical protein
MGPGNTPYVAYTLLPNYGPPAMIGLATVAQQQQACIDATEELDSYFRGRYALPLLAWGSDVVKMAAYIALKNIAELVGYAPQAGSDSNIRTQYYQVVGWPDRPGSGWGPGVQKQAIHPDVTPSVAPGQDPGHDVPQVFSAPQRGWTNRLGPQRVG